MMFKSRRCWKNDMGGTRRGMQRALRKEKVISVYAKDGLLLTHYEEGHGRIREEMPQLPSTGQLDPHPPTKPTQHGHPMALPYLRA